MKLLKRIIAVMAALLIAVKLVVVTVLAAAAPVVAGSIVVLLTTLLLAAGHSQSELSSMSVTQMQSLLGDDLRNGRINSSTVVVDPITQREMTVLDYYLSISNDVSQTQSNASVIIGNEIKDLITKALVGADYYFEPTSTFDLLGYGARIDYYTNGKLTSIYFCDYMVYYPDSPPTNNDLRTFGVIHCYSVGFNGALKYDYDLNVTSWYRYHQDVSAANYCKYYGDIRYADGTEVPTDEDEFEYVVGEADGTKVTVDMLNPDGSVTIDGVTYYPSDYLDPDKLTEEGKKELINNITNSITNIYVVADDKPIVDVDDITIEVSEEFQDYMIPTGIATVFPFSLPFDFVRGLQTLVEKPKVPVFKSEIDLTDFCGYDLGKHTIEISLEKWEPAAVVCRWFFTLLFIYTLILLSSKIVKGAGA